MFVAIHRMFRFAATTLLVFGIATPAAFADDAAVTAADRHRPSDPPGRQGLVVIAHRGASGYGDEALDAWARRIRTWRTGGVPKDVPRIERTRPARGPRDAYCYFDNDAKVRAPFDARGLMKRLGG